MKHALNTAKLGEVLCIALGDEEFGYLRIYKGGRAGIYPLISKGLLDSINSFRTIAPKWYFGTCAPPDEKVTVIPFGELPFAEEEAAWPPPCYSPPDVLKSYHRIYERGQFRRSTEAETRGLQRWQMASPTWMREFLLGKRNECIQVVGTRKEFDPLLNQASVMEEGPFHFEIVFRHEDFALRQRNEVENRLGDVLKTKGLGDVTGGGIGTATMALDVEVSDLTQGLRVIRDTLVELGCPATTEIHQNIPKHIVHQIQG